MEFDKTKVYTALNADESLIGAKGYFADDLASLRNQVACEFPNDLKEFKEVECNYYIKSVNSTNIYNFFYLVEPAPEKWYVFECSDGSYTEPILLASYENCKVAYSSFIKEECEQWIAEHSKPKYRPFKDCDELIEIWCNKIYNNDKSKYLDLVQKYKLELPTIWVKHKSIYTKHLIIDFGDNFCSVSHPARNELKGLTLEELFENYTFLDGSVCGVEE